MAARKPPREGRAWTPQKVRDRIRTGLLVHRLQRQALGKLELTAAQQKATEILLKKTLPDLSRTEHSGAMSFTKADELPESVLSNIAIGSGTGAAGSADFTPEPDEIH